MRRTVLALLSTVTGLVLLLGFKTAPSGASARPAALSPAPAPSTAPAPAPSTAVAAPSTAAATATRTVQGGEAQTRYGPVQVAVVLSGTKITNVRILEAPSDRPRDAEISNEALPILVSETISAQSAQIDAVSGATYTSDGYLQSLQSALDAAR